mgnify:CR=1 FL=1
MNLLKDKKYYETTASYEEWLEWYHTIDKKQYPGYSFTVDNVIFINSSISNFEKEFVIAHEVGHYEFHDDSIRQFSKIEAFKGSREETQANLFATIFLQAKYKDCDNNDEIQKIINYVWCNYLNLYE